MTDPITAFSKCQVAFFQNTGLEAKINVISYTLFQGAVAYIYARTPYFPYKQIKPLEFGLLVGTITYLFLATFRGHLSSRNRN